MKLKLLNWVDFLLHPSINRAQQLALNLLNFQIQTIFEETKGTNQTTWKTKPPILFFFFKKKRAKEQWHTRYSNSESTATAANIIPRVITRRNPNGNRRQEGRPLRQSSGKVAPHVKHCLQCPFLASPTIIDGHSHFQFQRSTTQHKHCHTLIIFWPFLLVEERERGAFVCVCLCYFGVWSGQHIKRTNHFQRKEGATSDAHVVALPRGVVLPARFLRHF